MASVKSQVCLERCVVLSATQAYFHNDLTLATQMSAYLEFVCNVSIFFENYQSVMQNQNFDPAYLESFQNSKSENVRNPANILDWISAPFLAEEAISPNCRTVFLNCFFTPATLNQAVSPQCRDVITIG